MAATTLSRRMSAEDARFLYFEKPDAPLHIGSIAIYEGTIPFEKMYASMDTWMHPHPALPAARPDTALLYAGHPTWEDDPKFSLDRHLKLVQLPAPGTQQQLLELCGDLFAENPSRATGRSGTSPRYTASKATARRTSAASTIAWLTASQALSCCSLCLTRAGPEPTPPPAEPWQPKEAAPPARDGPTPCPTSGSATCTPSPHGSRTCSTRVRSPADHRVRPRARDRPACRPPAARRTPWNKPIGGKRRAAVTEMSFREVRGIRSALGGTVNDVC